MLVVFDADTILSAPGVPLSVNPAPFHEHEYTPACRRKNGPTFDALHFLNLGEGDFRLGYNCLPQHTCADLETSVRLPLQGVQRLPSHTVIIDDVDFLRDLALRNPGLPKLETSVPVDR